jgi:hypothetical protein
LKVYAKKIDDKNGVFCSNYFFANWIIALVFKKNTLYAKNSDHFIGHWTIRSGGKERTLGICTYLHRMRSRLNKVSVSYPGFWSRVGTPVPG